MISNIVRTITILIMMTTYFGITPFASFASVASAAPAPSEIELDPKKEKGSKATAEEEARAQTVHVTPAPPLIPDAANDKDYFFKYRNAVTIRSGVEDIQNPGPVLGVLLLYSTRELKSFEAGADLSRDGNGTLHIAVRHLLERERVRWFYKYGAGIRVVASDQLVTFLRLKNWQLRGGGGFEWTLSDPISLRFDLEAILGSEKLSAMGTVGLAFGW